MTPDEIQRTIEQMRATGDLPANLTNQSVKEMSKSMANYFGDLGKTKVKEFTDKARELAQAALRVTEEKPLSVPEAPGGVSQLGETATPRGLLQDFLESHGATNIADTMNMEFFLRVPQEIAMGAGKFIRGNADPDMVAEFPAMELKRVYPRDVPRGSERDPAGPENGWDERWKAACDDADDDDAARVFEETDRMIALKDSGVWQALGDGAGDYDDTLGNPFAPFAFNSGMETDEIPRKECIELGLLDDDEEPEMPDLDLGDLIGGLMAHSANNAAWRALHAGDAEGHPFRGNQWTAQELRDKAGAIQEHMENNDYFGSDPVKIARTERMFNANEAKRMVLLNNAKALDKGSTGHHFLYETDKNAPGGIGAAIHLDTSVPGKAELKWIGSTKPGAGSRLIEQAKTLSKAHGASTIEGESKWGSAKYYEKHHGATITDADKGDLGGILNDKKKFSIPLHGRSSLEAGDVSGHEFHGNQWTERAAITPEEKEKKLTELKTLREAATPLAQKGGLTKTEAEQFKALNQKANAIRFELAKPLNLDKLPSASERMSTLPANVVKTSHNDLMRDKNIFMPVTEAAGGVHHNADTAVDDIMNGKNKDVSAQKFYDNFKPTRDALKEHYGDEIELHRAVGAQKSKTTTNWATTEDYARQFGNNVVSKKVPVSDVLAVNVGPFGKYHEVIVGKPPGAVKASALAASSETGHPFYGNQYTQGYAGAEAFKLDKIHGHSTVAAIRGMAKAGFSKDEIQKVMNSYGIPVNTSTIAIQMKRPGHTPEFTADQLTDLHSRKTSDAPKPEAPPSTPRPEKPTPPVHEPPTPPVHSPPVHEPPKSDAPKDTRADYPPAEKKHLTFEDVKNVKHVTFEQASTTMALRTEHSADVSEEQKAQFRQEADKALKPYHPQALRRLVMNCERVKMLNPKEFNMTYGSNRAASKYYGFYSPGSKRVATLSTSTYPQHGIMAHEYGHAIDRKTSFGDVGENDPSWTGFRTGRERREAGYHYSTTPAWKKAWRTDCPKSDMWGQSGTPRLRAYGFQNAQEGFACSVEHAAMHSKEDLKKRAPNMTALLEKWKILA